LLFFDEGDAIVVEGEEFIAGADIYYYYVSTERDTE
jgi:hypothetical protein